MIVVPLIRISPKTNPLKRAHPRGELGGLATKLSEKYEKVYVEDVDGIVKNKPQLDVAQEICEEIPALYEGGVRNSSNVIDMLITGAERAVVGTTTLASLDELSRAFKLSENITFKVDFRDGILSFDPDISGRAFLDLTRAVVAIGIVDIVVPVNLAKEAAAAKGELGFGLGVFASVAQRASMESLGVDYIVSEDFGSLGKDE